MTDCVPEDRIDPITFEVVKNALGSMVDEMALIIMRTAHSGVI
jgi:N-methylhydantoinase B